MRKGFRLAILVAILILLVLNTIGLVYLNNKRIADEKYRFAVSGALNEFIQHQTTVNDAQATINESQDAFQRYQDEVNISQFEIDKQVARLLLSY